MKDYNEYLSNGGDKTIYDWRRENVNNLIEIIYDIQYQRIDKKIKEAKKFKLPTDMSDARLYKQAGNSVCVPVINRIAEQIVEASN